MSAMSREEFEVWLEDHKDEALDRIEADNLRPARWIALFGASLKSLASEDTDDTEEEGDLFGEY
jgi:hypothetical protein